MTDVPLASATTDTLDRYGVLGMIGLAWAGAFASEPLLA